MTNRAIFYTFLISLITFLSLSSIAIFFFYDFQKREKIYVVDVEKIYTEKRERLKELVMSNAPKESIDAYNEQTIKYMKKVDNYLLKLSDKNHITIFNKKAVFFNNQMVDLTERVIDENR